MDIHTNISLKNYTTMKIGGAARFFAEANSVSELQNLHLNAVKQNIPLFIIGGGSNLIAHDEGYNGLVVHMQIPGFEIIADDLYHTTIKIGAGENWDDCVQKIVDMNLNGIETLSGIPGTAGAAPVQNIGAYGQEIADTLVSLEAYDTTSRSVITLTSQNCEFSYRHSIFRGSQQGRYIITSITLKLSKSPPVPPFYEGLQSYLEANFITTYTAKIIREAVLQIRADKLPDPNEKPNTGSFFKNAIIENWQVTELQKKFPDAKVYDMGDGRSKVPTGWLIDKAGLKGSLIHGMRVHDKNALVLINESARGYSDLAAARDEIIGKIRDTFQIIIEQEPLEII